MTENKADSKMRKRSSPMRKFWLLVAVILLLAGGLCGAWYYGANRLELEIRAEEAGSRLIILQGPNGFSVTKVVPIQPGEQRIELNLPVVPGNGWELRLKAGKPLGDAVADLTQVTGLDKVAQLYTNLTGKDCGCQSRQEKLNRLFSG